MNVIGKYASLVKFAHTVFALPFALAGYFWAVEGEGYGFSAATLLLMLVCMVLARNAAMGFNRWADHRIDSRNPRTAGREIPAGVITPRMALWFVIFNAAGFIVAAGFLNTLALWLSPLALAVILGYSYTKRFTWMSHFWLGLALGIAPVGAYVAVAGSFSMLPVFLACLVVSWVGGFDILYSLQDSAFDRANGLKSVPARFSIEQSLGISLGVHMASLVITFYIGLWFGLGHFYWIGTALFAAILVIQHSMVGPRKLDRIGPTFTLVNGLSSIVYSVFFILDLYL